MSRPSKKKVKTKIGQAVEVLRSVDLPKQQQNARSALTLLALLGLKSNDDWVEAQAPRMGITPIMDYIRDHYAREYAPNTRETIRRQTMHQFVEAGVAIQNPDKPNRPVNSPKWCYQIAPDMLDLVRSFDSPSWQGNLAQYLKQRTTLAEQYAKEREMQLIPLKIGNKKTLRLTPGKHSQLIRDIITEFGPRYAPGAEVLYVGDTGSKMRLFKKTAFKRLGLIFDSHGKFPDVVLYLRSKNWLLLVEAVTSHGPVNPKRRGELASLFAGGKAGLIFVTAFSDRQTMAKYLAEISWETEVWAADAPTHLIHFNGERFLGPYDE